MTTFYLSSGWTWCHISPEMGAPTGDRNHGTTPVMPGRPGLEMLCRQLSSPSCPSSRAGLAGPLSLGVAADGRGGVSGLRPRPSVFCFTCGNMVRPSSQDDTVSAPHPPLPDSFCPPPSISLSPRSVSLSPSVSPSHVS